MEKRTGEKCRAILLSWGRTQLTGQSRPSSEWAWCALVINFHGKDHDRMFPGSESMTELNVELELLSCRQLILTCITSCSLLVTQNIFYFTVEIVLEYAQLQCHQLKPYHISTIMFNRKPIAVSSATYTRSSLKQALVMKLVDSHASMYDFGQTYIQIYLLDVQRENEYHRIE